MKKFLTLILTIVLLATSLTMTSCAPSKKSAVIPVDYMVTYTYMGYVAVKHIRQIIRDGELEKIER